VATFIIALVAPMAFGAPGIIGGLSLGHGAIITTAPAATLSVQKSIVQHPSIIATPIIAASAPVIAAAPVGLGLSHGIGLSGIVLGGHGW